MVLLVLMILECLKTGKRALIYPLFPSKTYFLSGARSERDIKDFVTEKCKKCGMKATNRGTIAGANLEISSACNILGAMGVLEQSSLEERIEPDLVNIPPGLPEPPADESKVEDYLSFLAWKWNKTIDALSIESQQSQASEIASSSSIQPSRPPPPLPPSSSSHTQSNPQQTSSSSSQPPPLLLPPASSSSSSAGGAFPSSSSAINSSSNGTTHDLSIPSSKSLLPPSNSLQTSLIAPPPPSSSSTSSSLIPSHLNPPSSSSHLPLLNSSQPLPTNSSHSQSHTADFHDDMDFVDLLFQSHDQLTHPSSSIHPDDLPPPLIPLDPSQTQTTTATNVTFSQSNLPPLPSLQHPSEAEAKEEGNKPSTSTSTISRKSASSTKIWKLRSHLKMRRPAAKTTSSSRKEGGGEEVVEEIEAEEGEGSDQITKFLFTAEKILSQWGEESFYEHISLEIEEKLLRRVAGQCTLYINPDSQHNKPLDNNLNDPNNPATDDSQGGSHPSHVNSLLIHSHVGTRYLDPHYSNNNIDNIPMTSSTASNSLTTPGGGAAPSSSSGKGKSGGGSRSKNAQSSSNSASQLPKTPKDSAAETSSSSVQPKVPEDLLAPTNLPKEYQYNDSTTALSLIEKVKKSKRQKGHCLSSIYTGYNQPLSSSASSLYSPNQFSSAYLNTLKNIAQKTASTYWEFPLPSSPTGDNKKSSKSGQNGSSSYVSSINSSGSEKISAEGMMTVAEYAKTLHLSNVTITNSFLNSNNFNANNILLNGAYPNLSVNLFRRYVPPLSIYNYERSFPSSQPIIKPANSLKSSSAKPSSKDIISSPICYPDLLITTLEIPWKTIVPEFQVIRSEEMGLSFYNEQSHLPNYTLPLSHSTTELLAQLPKPTSKTKGGEKIHRSASFDAQAVQSVNSTIFRCRSVSEVFAPAYREVSLGVDSNVSEYFCFDLIAECISFVEW